MKNFYFSNLWSSYDEEIFNANKAIIRYFRARNTKNDYKLNENEDKSSKNLENRLDDMILLYATDSAKIIRNFMMKNKELFEGELDIKKINEISKKIGKELAQKIFELYNE
ncbi:MAG: hypothetical protein QXX55_00780 [Candidatus Pacearchaeota archaeon]